MKTEFKGTPGPWYPEKYKHAGGYEELTIGAVIDPQHGHSTTICIMSDYEEDQMNDNARLIAAAPELLEVLTEMVYIWENGLCKAMPSLSNEPAYLQARAAITKALEP